MGTPATQSPVLAYDLGGALYLNVTSACTLACVFCPKIRDGDFTVGPYDLRLTGRPSAADVLAAATRAGLDGRPEVVFTGFGEPTLRLDVVLEVSRALRALGVARIRIDTDGLASLREGRDVVPELAAAGVTALSVSLNAPDGATYARVCPSRFGEAAFAAVRDFIARAVKVIPDVAASAVALPGLPEEACRRAAEELGARFRWRPYDRLGRVEGGKVVAVPETGH